MGSTGRSHDGSQFGACLQVIEHKLGLPSEREGQAAQGAGLGPGLEGARAAPVRRPDAARREGHDTHGLGEVVGFRDKPPPHIAGGQLLAVAEVVGKLSYLVYADEDGLHVAQTRPTRERPGGVL